MTEYRSLLHVSASESPYTLIVEPWAEEFEIAPGGTCQIVAIHPVAPSSFEVELNREYLIVYVRESGSTYEFWRDGKPEAWTSIAIPGFEGR